MVRILADTSTLYSTAQAEQARETLAAVLSGAVIEIYPLSPAFITQGGPGCVAVQYIHI